MLRNNGARDITLLGEVGDACQLGESMNRPVACQTARYYWRNK